MDENSKALEELKRKKEQEEQLKLPPQKRKRTRTKKGSALYIDGAEMMTELEKYNETGEISEKLGEMFLKLATRYTSKPNFMGYSYRDEMIADCVLRMISQIHKFDVTHPARNPFSYFTQICYHQCLTTRYKEIRQDDIKKNVRQKLWTEVCESENILQTDENDYNDLEDN